jgi:hypothetical protein
VYYLLVRLSSQITDLDERETQIETRLMKHLQESRETTDETQFATLQKVTSPNPAFPVRTRSLSASGMGLKPSHVTGIRKSSVTSVETRPGSDRGNRMARVQVVQHDEQLEEDVLPTDSARLAWSDS